MVLAQDIAVQAARIHVSAGVLARYLTMLILYRTIILFTEPYIYPIYIDESLAIVESRYRFLIFDTIDLCDSRLSM